MRLIGSFLLAISSLALFAGPTAANDPTYGATYEYAPGTNVSYRFGLATYPTWMQTATKAALGPDWDSATFNNSRLARFTYSPSGTGQVVYSAASLSPCNTGNPQWLQCASNWGSPSFRIYVRNFSAAPYSNWTWCNIAFAGTCWDMERALMHEAEHVTMGVGGHSNQGEANTVMGGTSPWYPNIGWNTRHIQRCDHAAAQLINGMANPSGPLADCFENVAGHGTVGLRSALSASSTSLSVCTSQTAVLSGGLGVAVSSGYQRMSGAPLGGRTVWFDRKPRTSSVWTLNIASAVTSASGSWSRGFSTGSAATVTYDFRAHVSSETGLDGSTGPVIGVTWRSGC
ncbi:MAG: hypothetical protein ABIP77_03940 [Candidatus Limnocylindrales bacterium]